jgi:magnesium transporter
MTQILAITKDGVERLETVDRRKKLWIIVDDKKNVKEVLESVGIKNDFFVELLAKDSRPRVEEFEGGFFVILRRPNRGGSSQVSFVLGKNFLVSMGAEYESARKRVEMDDSARSLERLLYLLLDSVLDEYFRLIEGIEEEIARLETELLSRPDESTMKKIYSTNRKLTRLRRMSWPLRDVFGTLEAEDSLGEKERFRDLYERGIQIMESIEVNSELLSEMIEIYLESINRRLSEIMKVLTIVSTIFIPLTFIVGVYGMNFRNMPELEWEYSYPAVLAFMVVITVAMIFYFRKKGWM